MKKKEILIIDDEAQIRALIKNVLTLNGYLVTEAASKKETLAILKEKSDFQLILLDVNLVDSLGYEIARNILTDLDIPIIFLTGNTDPESKKNGFEAGCVDYITKPFETNEILYRIKLHIELAQRRKEAINYVEILEKKVKNRTKEISLTRKALIMSLASLAETRDPETGAHLLRTQEYTLIIAEFLSKQNKYRSIINQNFIHQIYDCSPLHDIGKVGIPDNILLKAGKLSTAEFEIMKKHTTIGKQTLESTFALLGEIPFLKIASEIAVSHHERYNGRGYPFGLTGDNIPLSGRIMSLADVFDALTNKRVYKDAWSEKDVTTYIISQKGQQLDPDVVEAFCATKEMFMEINHKYQDL